MGKEYTQAFKDSMIQKILLNPEKTVVNYARQANVPVTTVATWLSRYRQAKGDRIILKKPNKKFTAENKFEIVLQTSAMSEIEKNQYCRKKGIYPEEVEQWRQDCISGCRNSPDRVYQKKAKQKEDQLKKKTRELQKELNRKDKALAETAALLVLKKKVQEIWGEQEEE